jgi:hypothetical protein
MLGICLEPDLEKSWIPSPTLFRNRYRVGDYRLICDIQVEKIVILVLEIEDRKEMYR